MSNNTPDYNENLFFDPNVNTMPRCDIEELQREIKHLKDLQANQDKEVESLRELLKECKFYVEKDFECIRANGWTKEGVFNDLYELLTRINAAIGESEEL